ncbi:MAG: alanine--tRNA ligase [Mesoaciditoga sp.]|uniref:alanine--tRNA ligase n=1 Tax=Athalassotoga sp. TaxID=2022597 RepID=UPI000CB67786|nr:MAG: alanine--tRNA ligase [Mesoaciditoga sp.]PMP79635.1 MAG: alanine--tRNA ligase [Mesoaciditoga sp.]HEU23601.1 alanine--tRNA ligase [Mesoaciditoga lauensis]
MKNLSSEQIRKEFLEFFKSKGHEILPSISLIPDDPQLLFTVAGMVPFKKIFWGLEDPKYPRVATVQKCIRTNDIENVGRTPRHHTFFEMLGNFSFGDYFKKEAIEYAWEFLTQRLEIDPSRLWVSIYKDDDEAFEIWTKDIGIDPRKIVRMGKEDNFWGPVGPSGPCGPDSEIFYDLKIPVKECPDPDKCTPACGCNRFLEIWNLVFTGLYQDENGNIGELKRKNIDTGMGLERIASVLQGVKSNFETDLFMPLIHKSENIFSVKYGAQESTDISMRIIADHARAATFLIADGVSPSNTERGYVLRRLIRRAVRYGQLMGADEPFLYKYVSTVEEIMGKSYPEIVERRSFIVETIKNEEERFLKTLDQGLAMVERIISTSKNISGEEAFKLYDTYGMPLDILLDISNEKNVQVDVESFNRHMEEQKRRSRENLGVQSFVDSIYESISNFKTEFVGYESFESESKIVAMISNGEETGSVLSGNEAEVIFDKTPFYAEMGGQVGDTGRCEFSGGYASVIDTYQKANLHIHKIKVESGTLRIGMNVKLIVDERRRKSIARNHTATHLLQAALQKVLGDHVRQFGSYVGPEKLRFDFTHNSPLTPEEIEKIIMMVNDEILKAIDVKTKIMPLEEAKKIGAMALFGEKYSDTVRVVFVDDFSKELCGGTHVSNTGEIGIFMITSERGVSAGVRRIEATTGTNVLKILLDQSKMIENLSSKLSCQKEEIENKVKILIDENQELIRENGTLRKNLILQNVKEQCENSRKNGKKFVITKVENLNSSDLRDVADDALRIFGKGVVVILQENDEKTTFIVKSTLNNANEIASNLSKHFGGKGGGKGEMAQGGWNGKVDTGKVEKILEELLK